MTDTVRKTPPQICTYTTPPTRRLSDLHADGFEIGLMAVMRHFLMARQRPDSQAWEHAFQVAVERWGDEIGLAAAFKASAIIRAVLKTRKGSFDYCDPLDPDQRGQVAQDEILLIRMIHHMRRDNTTAARDAVDQLAHGRMDPDLIRAGLALAHRFPAGITAPNPQGRATKRPVLSIVT